MAIIQGDNKATRGTSINEQYFSGTQTSIFIGDVWVDDIFSIDYNVQHSRSPQFGYGSQHFDFLPKGVMIVTGSFAINFREPNYLWIILDRFKKFNKSPQERLEDSKNRDAENASLSYEGDKRQRFDSFFNDNNPETAKENLLKQSRQVNGLGVQKGEENFNHPAFDIVIGYGADLSSDSPGEIISNVHVVGRGKVINTDGRPVQEQYNFIARRLV
jgi:hypothetical protein